MNNLKKDTEFLNKNSSETSEEIIKNGEFNLLGEKVHVQFATTLDEKDKQEDKLFQKAVHEKVAMMQEKGIKVVRYNPAEQDVFFE